LPVLHDGLNPFLLGFNLSAPVSAPDGRVNIANPAAEEMMQVGPGGVTGKSLLELGDAFSQALADLKIGSLRIVALCGSRRVKCSRFVCEPEGELLKSGSLAEHQARYAHKGS
jgi:hypothetical protein